MLKIENITVIKDVLLQCFINVLIRTLLVVKSEIMPNQELAKELHKPIIIEFVKRKVHSFFIDNVWGADLADMQLISKFNKEFWFSLCVIDIYCKCAWVVRLKDKKDITNTNNAFQKILNEFNLKPNKIWVDKESEFYNRSMKSGLQDNDIEMCSIHNEEKPVVAKRFIRTLNNEIYKYVTSVSKNVYIIT